MEDEGAPPRLIFEGWMFRNAAFQPASLFIFEIVLRCQHEPHRAMRVKRSRFGFHLRRPESIRFVAHYAEWCCAASASSSAACGLCAAITFSANSPGTKS
jgi:hypothetical protein